MSATSAPSTKPRSEADLERLNVRYDAAFEGISPPFAFVDLEAMRSNAALLSAQAAPLPVRIASKSVRSMALLQRIFELGAELGGRFRGILSFTLPEALHLARAGYEDIFVGYPTADRAALAELAAMAAERPGSHPALIADEPAHLDLIESAAGRGSTPIRVAVDIDPSWWPGRGRVARIGPKRSPIRTAAHARRFAAEIAERPGTRLVGAMAYEGHIAGVGDIVPGNPGRSAAIRTMQRRSLDELAERLPGVIDGVRDAAGGELEWVNMGGTGSLARSRDLGLATELTAGSGFYAPALFDNYRSLDLTPAAFFCVPVVRRPHPGVATALGGGYVASGGPARDRLPQPYLPAGLTLDSDEGAGEVQTPLVGAAAKKLRVGDRVYMRHAKAGELCERFDSLYLVEGDAIVDQVATYRGDGLTFL